MSVSENQSVDSIGRRRQPGQNSGLKRPEPLPDGWQGRSIRISLPESDWLLLDSLIANLAPDGASRSMAMGKVLHQLLSEHQRSAQFQWSPDDWMEWERRKTLRLLRLAV